MTEKGNKGYKTNKTDEERGSRGRMEEEDEGGRLNGEGVTDPCPNQVKERWPTVASEGANETSVRVFFLFFSPFFSCPSAVLARSLPSERVGRRKKKDTRFQTPVVQSRRRYTALSLVRPL